MNHDYKNIKVIGFDADDTLWVNETFFREGEHRFAELMAPYETENKVLQELLRVELDNLPIYGYGIKGFVLSMMECALELSNKQIGLDTIDDILQIGKTMLHKPVELLDGVEEVLSILEPKYRVLLLTKGDLLDQERKLEKSGLSKYIHHVEVLSEKKEKNYQDLLDNLEIKNEEFLMVGNSLKSDVLPIINIGSKSIHIPFHTTWIYEEIEIDDKTSYQSLSDIKQILKLLD